MRPARSPPLRIPTRPRWARPQSRKVNHHDDNRHFHRTQDGFTGTVRTLTVNVKVKIVTAEKTNDKAPDYRILAGNFEIGAAWKKTAQNSQRDYLAVTLDDPSFPSTLYANLVQTDGSDDHSLIWSRNKND